MSLLICGAVFWLLGIVCILAPCKAAARGDRAIDSACRTQDH